MQPKHREPSRPTAHGAYIDGPNGGFVTGGRLGGVAPEPPAPAGSDAAGAPPLGFVADAAHGLGGDAERLEAYRERLTSKQRAVLDFVAGHVQRNGVIPDDAMAWMEKAGPWPDPFEDTR